MRNLALFSALCLAPLLRANGTSVLFHDDFSTDQPGWEIWKPNPGFGLEVGRVRNSAGQWRLRMAGIGSAHSSPQAKSRQFRTITGLKTGEWYRFDAAYSIKNVVNPANAVMTVVQWTSFRHYRIFAPKVQGSEVTSTLMLKLPEETKGSVNLHLFAGYIPGGTVEWKSVSVTHVPSYTAPSRPVAVSVIDSVPPKLGPVEDNARHYAAEIDKASSPKRSDIILLPEHVNTTKVSGKAAVSMESEYMKILREAARRNRTYVAGSIHEERDGMIFNTGFLLDREGRTAGSYSKAHLTVGEMVFSPLARGEEWKVFQTDFGKVGVLVCLDFHFPEAARILALQGAELLLVPMAADARLKEDGRQRGAEHSGKAFVLENRVPIVFAATLGSDVQPSLIIDQSARILARSNSAQHIIRGELDLDEKVIQWSGNDFQSVYKLGRRPELYGPLGLK